MSQALGEEGPVCTLKHLDEALDVLAAQHAKFINPANAPLLSHPSITNVLPPSLLPSPEYLAALTSRYWGEGGVKLTVGFLEQTPADLRDRILSHMNAWGSFCNAEFVYSQTDAQVRITRAGDGYWSYLGTDILQIPRGEPTMCLQEFTMRTQESEFIRVVRHETGHTMGFPHEHVRAEIIKLLDEQKTIAYFRRTQGWSPSTTRQQVLTPIAEKSLLSAGEAADVDSIMCYMLPASITKDGRAVPGGADFSNLDRRVAGKLYPRKDRPDPPPTPVNGALNFDEMRLFKAGKEIARYSTVKKDAA